MVRVRKKSFGGIITIDEPENVEPVESSKVVDSAIFNSQSEQTQNLHQASNALFRGILTLTSSEEKGIKQDLGELGSFICAMQQEGLTNGDIKDCLVLHYDFLNQARENSGKNPYPTDV